MTATVLFKLLKAPILLTDSDKLDERVKAEIERLGARDIIIVGGNLSIIEKVKLELKKYNKDDVERLSGCDRYATSVAVAKRVTAITDKDRAVIASGEVFSDVIVIGPLAGKDNAPNTILNEYLNGR